MFLPQVLILFYCDSPNHGVISLPHKKYLNNIAENKKKFITMNQSQGGSGGGKACAKRSNKKGWINKYQKQQKSIRRKTEIEILIEKMGFTLLMASGCSSVTRVLI